MKILNYLIGFLLLVAMITGNSYAESSQFKVLASNGDITVSHKGGNWSKITSNIKIGTNDKIKVGKNSYLGLVHNSGRTVELEKEGVYEVTKLVEQVSRKASNLTKRLADYVMGEIGSADNLMKSDDYHKHMSVTGSVERSLDNIDLNAMEKQADREKEIGFGGKDLIEINAPKKTTIMNSVADFTWHEIKGVKKYTIHITDRFEREVLTKDVDNTAFSVNFYDYNLDKDVYYFWYVTATNKPVIRSDEFAFKLMSDAEVEKVKAEIQGVLDSFGDNISPAESIMLAAFYQEKGLYNEALQSYKRATELLPDVEAYAKLYSVFQYKMKTGNY